MPLLASPGRCGRTGGTRGSGAVPPPARTTQAAAQSWPLLVTQFTPPLSATPDTQPWAFNLDRHSSSVLPYQLRHQKRLINSY